MTKFFKLIFKYHPYKIYREGSFIKWIIGDKKGNPIYCYKCGNYSNGVAETRLLKFFLFKFPMCKTHLEEMYFKERPKSGDLVFPCHVKIKDFKT